jgi:hypothetical protein
MAISRTFLGLPITYCGGYGALVHYTMLELQSLIYTQLNVSNLNELVVEIDIEL